MARGHYDSLAGSRPECLPRRAATVRQHIGRQFDSSHPRRQRSDECLYLWYLASASFRTPDLTAGHLPSRSLRRLGRTLQSAICHGPPNRATRTTRRVARRLRCCLIRSISRSVLAVRYLSPARAADDGDTLNQKEGLAPAGGPCHTAHLNFACHKRHRRSSIRLRVDPIDPIMRCRAGPIFTTGTVRQSMSTPSDTAVAPLYSGQRDG